MNPQIKETLLCNRVKIMKLCDYFIVSAPLIARKILPMEKHKDFKNLGANIADAKAANNTRMDALLEYIDECNAPGAFDAFLEGIKNCDGQKSFAKSLKKDAEGGMVTGKPAIKTLKPKLTTAMKKPKTPSGAPVGSLMTINGPQMIAGGMVTPGGAGKGPGKKTPAKTTPIIPGFTYFNTAGPGKNVKPPPMPPTTLPVKVGPKKANPPEGGKRAAGAPKPPKKPVLSPMGPPPPGLAEILAFVARGQIPAPGLSAGGSLPAVTVKKESTPGTSAPAVPSTSTGSSGAAPPASAGGFVVKIPAGSPFRPRDGLKRNAAPKSKPMTFQEVETKQRGASRAATFSFLSPAAVVKTIHFNNKSDLFYEGCPSKIGNSWCAKKVQLKGKGKKYVCKEKHENESYNLFPRLYVTFEDGTTHIQTVLFRENVEILSGKTVSEMQSMNDEQIKKEFFKAVRKNIPIEVKCKKIAQKDLKKSDGATWENIATVVLDQEEKESAPAAKRGRKSVD